MVLRFRSQHYRQQVANAQVISFVATELPARQGNGFVSAISFAVPAHEVEQEAVVEAVFHAAPGDLALEAPGDQRLRRG